MRLLTLGLMTSALGGLVLLAVVAAARSGASLGLAGIPGAVVRRGRADWLHHAERDGPGAVRLRRRTAGSASALLGLLQFGLGAVVAPLVGLGGSATALPMALTMARAGVGGAGWRSWCSGGVLGWVRLGGCWGLGRRERQSRRRR